MTSISGISASFSASSWNGRNVRALVEMETLVKVEARTEAEKAARILVKKHQAMVRRKEKILASMRAQAKHRALIEMNTVVVRPKTSQTPPSASIFIQS